ncbi:hypothetical protein ACF0H5_013830 [Mactra antiquata]
MERGIYITLVGMLAMFSCYVHGCQLEPGVMSPTGVDDDPKKIYYSDYVIYGEVIRNHTGNVLHTNINGIYAAEVSVLCNYRGNNVPSDIIVTGLGNLNNELPNCPVASMNGSTDGVFFLRRIGDSNVFETQFAPNTGAIEIILDDLTIYCGLNLTGNPTDLCIDYEPLPVGECEQYIPPTTLEPPTTTEGSTDEDAGSVEVDTGDSQGDNDEGYETQDNTDESNEESNAEAEESSDPTGGASMLVGTVFAYMSAVFLTLLHVL